MITITNLSKNYGKKVLFDNLSLTINKGEKIGLIGPNGAGKSTFFSMILSETEPSSGSIEVHRNVRIGYLPQEAHFSSGHTVLSELTENVSEIIGLKKEKEQLETEGQAGSMRYGEILHELEVLGYFELEHKAEKILMGLGFKEKDFNRPINQMSGGWQMRVLLAKLLTFSYDILLLDEPTNYLDLNAAVWLKDYLANLDSTFIMISHDKAFLNEVTNYSLILQNGSVFKVKGNYEHFEQIQEEKRTFLLRQYKEQEKKRKQLEDFVARFHAQPNKASSVRAKRTILERMEEIAVPPNARESIRDFKFPQTKRSGYRVMQLKKMSKAYGDIQVYKEFDFEITQGEKAVLAGENGAGKSTLLKILAGVIPIDSGERIAGHNVDIGYFSQTRLDVLSPENTVLQEAYSAAPGFMSQEIIRTILAAFLFTGDDSEKKVSVLSGGEKSRLILAKLLINPPNFLLLDEPTTHLDVDAVDALVKALTAYEGTIVFISHDIYFVRSLASAVFEVRDGHVRKFPGEFDYYLEKRGQDSGGVRNIRQAPKELRPQDELKQKLKEEERLRREQEKQHREEEKRQRNCNTKIRQEITRLERQRERLELEHYAKAEALSNPRIFRNEEVARDYGRRIKDIEKEVSALSEEIKQLESQFIK